MKEAILILGMAAFIFAGFIFMKRADAFFVSEKKNLEKVKDKRGEALLFCGGKRMKNISNQCDTINCAAYPEGRIYNAVFAVSESDIDNLMLCATAKKRCASTLTVALCNERIYENVFHEKNVDIVVNSMCDAQRVINELVKGK